MKTVYINFRNPFCLLLVSLLYQTTFAQTELKTDGHALKTANGTAIVLRGVNSGLAEDGNFDISDLVQCKGYIDQIAMSGANAIRFTWYTDGVSWRDGGQYVSNSPTPEARYHKGNGTVMSGFISNGNLGAIFDYCKTKHIVVILAVHDLTCSNDWTYFNSDLKNWWLKPSVLSLISSHKDNLILNLANEFGMVRWNNNDVNDYNTFKTNYNSLISALRTAGVKVPVMIDAPDCGQSSSELMSIANSMLSADPQHNIIFSTHLYWDGYATTSNEIGTKLNESVTNNVCMMLGEVSSRQDNGACGNTDITSIYQSALTQACPLNINWLAWSWDQDCTNLRNMTTNGSYNTLTSFGSDIVNNANYGLKANNGCGAVAITTAINDIADNNSALMKWSHITNEVQFTETGTYTLYNAQGQLIQQANVVAGKTIQLNSLPQHGIYIMHFTNPQLIQATIKLVY